jgi:ribonuclease-3
MTDIRKLQAQLGYFFTDVALLRQALTHRSYGKLNNERLEFVGDGILDYVIALNLYLRYPDLTEGELSKMRAGLVNQEALVELSEILNLGQYLFLGDGEAKSGGRKRPSILADAMEAIFAAISLDSSFQEAKAAIERLYNDRFKNAIGLLQKDNKSLLQEYLQARRIKVPLYNVLESIGPDHDTIFNVECDIPELAVKFNAFGKSKKEASQAVAGNILKILKKRDK